MKAGTLKFTGLLLSSVTLGPKTTLGRGEVNVEDELKLSMYSIMSAPGSTEGKAKVSHFREKELALS